MREENASNRRIDNDDDEGCMALMISTHDNDSFFVLCPSPHPSYLLASEALHRSEWRKIITKRSEIHNSPKLIRRTVNILGMKGVKQET